MKPVISFVLLKRIYMVRGEGISSERISFYGKMFSCKYYTKLRSILTYIKKRRSGKDIADTSNSQKVTSLTCA